MRIVLLNSPSFTSAKYIKEGFCQGKAIQMTWPPVTLATIGALLGKLPDVSLRLIDGNALALTEEQLLGNYQAFFPDVVIVNTTTPTFPADVKGAALARKVNPEAKIVMLGPHATSLAEEIVASFQADIVIRNEPELTAYHLIRALINGVELSGIKGIVFKNNGEVSTSPEADFIDDLDSLPFPDRTLLDNKLYVHPLTWETFTVLRTSRGCPVGCTFCNAFYYGDSWRTRSPHNIVSELRQCVNVYGIRNFLMCSDNFTYDREAVMTLCREIEERRLRINWTCNSRVDTVDEELLVWMKKAGCQLITFGVESASEKILKLAKKNITPAMSGKAIGLARKCGIKSLGHFIFGLPGETEETVAETIAFALKLNPDYAEFLTAVPYPGTELSRYLQRQGWLKTGTRLRYDEDRCDAYDLPDLSGKEISRLPRKAYRAFYLRPSRIIGEIIHSLKCGGIKQVFSNGLSFLNYHCR